MTLSRRTFLATGCSACLILPNGSNAASPANTKDWQVVCGMGELPSFPGIGNLRPANGRATDIVSGICDLIGILPTFGLHEADFEHGAIAIAAIRKFRRHIVYDAKWFPFDEIGAAWYMVFILGHEIGHHLNGHTSGIGSNPHQKELEADRFGGWAVARLGGTQESALAFLPRLRETASQTHPARADRIKATREGWNAGKRLRFIP